MPGKSEKREVSAKSKKHKHKYSSDDEKHIHLSSNEGERYHRHRSRSHKKKSKKHKRYSSKDSSPDFVTNSKDRGIHNANYDSTGHRRNEGVAAAAGGQISICGYTDDSNPFMDPNLTNEFVWRRNKRQTKRNNEDKQRELENVQKRQRENEKLREERALEHELMQRAKEAQSFQGRKSDSSFDIEQAKSRSKIRIADGRAKPIDLLIQYVNEEENSSSSNTEAIIHEPSEFITGLSEEDLSALLIDIHQYSRNMEPGKNTQYWEDLQLIAEDELDRLTRRKHKWDANISKESMEFIRKTILEGTLEESETLLADAKGVLENGDNRHIDVSYWEYFCQIGRVLVAKKRLKERHSNNLRIKLNRLKQEQGFAVDPLFPSGVKLEEDEVNVFEDEKVEESNKLQLEREVYDKNLYSPVLLREDELGEDEAIENIIYRWEDDGMKLEFMRKKFAESGNHDISKEDELMKLVENGEQNGDMNFADEVVLQQEQSFLWSDKYRPRKPRFLNKVNTGFDWNKYNQTHYDIENPPPKIVQGYKFNILYPDLIDKSRTPTFELTPCAEDENYAVITFKAGPPYEDIAFKIVNREWETSERHGYKCQFYRDMLQLHFHFKRYRYRK